MRLHTRQETVHFVAAIAVTTPDTPWVYDPCWQRDVRCAGQLPGNKPGPKGDLRLSINVAAGRT
jgi:hypothetical protein